MFEVSVTGWFSAAHQLRLPGGELEPLHGHNWRVTVTCAGPTLDDMGVLLDFTRLKPRLVEILATMHDRHLNDLPAFAARNPSAENVAVVIAEALCEGYPGRAFVRCVEVEESPGCVARYFVDAPRS
ncbi:MAG: 6-carboxytetrahydropterin synthase [Phycisphaerales bacterium]|nr:6-carboxytetrahydropterin synthase [Phycisphaerales bacterium]